jgi:hypothetical protein
VSAAHELARAACRKQRTRQLSAKTSSCHVAAAQSLARRPERVLRPWPR